MKHLIFALLTLFLASCHELSEGDVLRQFQPRFQAKRDQLKAIAANLPRPGATLRDTCSRPPDPKPIYVDDTTGSNMGFLMEDELSNPDLPIEVSARFSLSNGKLLWDLQDTGPNTNLDRKTLKADQRFTARLEETLDYRYLLVNRVLKYTPPHLSGISSFTGGDVKLAAFLVDLERDDVICSLTVSADTPQEVLYSTPKIATGPQDYARSHFEYEAHYALVRRSRDSLAAKLGSLAGGTFHPKG